LSIIVGKGVPVPASDGHLGVMMRSLADWTRDPEHLLVERLAELSHAELAWCNTEDLYDKFPGAFAETLGRDRWPTWEEIQKFSRECEVPMSSLLVDLRFDLFGSGQAGLSID
jgi:hypothetical protein